MSKAFEVLPEADEFARVAANPVLFEGVRIVNGIKEKVGYVVVTEATGYGGPLTMVTAIDLEGKIVGTVIADYKDTPLFIQMVKNNDFLKQFVQRPVSDPFQLEQDIDAVSGATFSSRGITQAVAKGSHFVAKSQFALEVPETPSSLKFGYKEAVTIALLALMLIGVKFGLNKLRWVTLIGSLIFIGFKFNAAVSIGAIAGIAMGYFPPIQDYLFWYFWFLGIPVITFILGRNVYCFWLCPFGAVQEIAAKTGGGKFKCQRRVSQGAKNIKYVLAFVAVLIAFIKKAPGLASYEPFAALFSLQGFGIQWFILPVVLFASLFIARFWCQYFCPVWVATELIWKFRRRLDALLEGGRQLWIRANSALEK